MRGRVGLPECNGGAMAVGVHHGRVSKRSQSAVRGRVGLPECSGSAWEIRTALSIGEVKILVGSAQLRTWARGVGRLMVKTKGEEEELEGEPSDEPPRREEPRVARISVGTRAQPEPHAEAAWEVDTSSGYMLEQYDYS